MKYKFVIVSKDSSFKMNNDVFNSSTNKENIDVSFISDNSEALAKVYNKFIDSEKAIKSNDYLIFLHSDVVFDIDKFISHLESIHEKYDVIGLCGCAKFHVGQSPLNWFCGSRPSPNERWGCVTHGELGNQTSYFSSHSPNVLDHEVSCIDGLCIILNKKSIEVGLRFDETLGEFDTYDTDISLQAMMTYKLKLGVMVQLDLQHYSIGKSILTEKFLESEYKLRSKWKLPVIENSAIDNYIKSKAQK